MALRERLRELLFPLMITAIVCCVWILSRAQPLHDGAMPAYYPAPDPSLLERAMAAAGRDEVGRRPAEWPVAGASVDDPAE